MTYAIRVYRKGENTVALDKQGMKQIERETEIYKAFMKIAKKVSYLEYGKWKIVPDPVDPLRKFTLNKEFGWATLKVGVYLKDTYKRGVYDYDERYDYRGMISYTGLFKDKSNVELKMVSGLRVRPRVAKDLIKEVNEKIIPNFYTDIFKEQEARKKANEDIAEFMREIGIVKGLKQGERKQSWKEPTAILNGCPIDLTLQRGFVEVSGRLSYMQLKKMAEACGWGDYGHITEK